MHSVSAPSPPPINCLQVVFQTPSITTSECISGFTQSLLSRVSLNSLHFILQVRMVTAVKWVSNLTRSQPQRSHDNGLQVYVQTTSVMASRCTSEFTWFSSSAHPRIAPKDRLQLVQMYGVWMGTNTDTEIHKWEYKLNTWVLKIIQQ